MRDTVRAEFNPLIKPFLVLRIGVVDALHYRRHPAGDRLVPGRWPQVGAPLFDRLDCQPGARSLRYRKGILVTTEKTIPLENIQDVSFVEGPILRRFDLGIPKFETVGHSPARPRTCS